MMTAPRLDSGGTEVQPGAAVVGSDQTTDIAAAAGAEAAVADLRLRLQHSEQQLAEERSRSRAARMRAESIAAELKRRTAGEEALRAAMASLMAQVKAEPPQHQSAEDRAALENAAKAEVAEVTRLRAARDEVHAALLLARDDLKRARAETAATGRELAEARSDAGSARSELDATARELEEVRAELEQLRNTVGTDSARSSVSVDDRNVDGSVEDGADFKTLKERLEAMRRTSGERPASVAAAADDSSDVVAGLAAAASRLRVETPAGGRLQRRRVQPGAWMPTALARIIRDDRDFGEHALLELLAAQSLCVASPLTYMLEIADAGDYRVALTAQGAAIGPVTDTRADARVRGPLAALVEFAVGGFKPRGHRLRLQRKRRLMPLIRARRTALQLTDLAVLARPPEPEVLLRLLCAAIVPMAVDRNFVIDVENDGDSHPLRLSATVGKGIELFTGDRFSERPDATLKVGGQSLAAVLAGIRAAEVDGDLDVVNTLLAWFDRAQGS